MDRLGSKGRSLAMYRLGLEGIWDPAQHKKKFSFEFCQRDDEEVKQAMIELQEQDTSRGKRAQQAFDKKEAALALIEDIGQFGESVQERKVGKGHERIAALGRALKLC